MDGSEPMEAPMTLAERLQQPDAPRSWVEANGIEVTARTVGIARGAKA